jgi:hypothetical protein
MDQPCWDLARSLYGADALGQVQEAENSPSFLTRPGDWYLDRCRPGHHELPYRPRPGEDMHRATVVALVLEALVTGVGVHDVGFRGITFAYATWPAPSGPAGFPAAWSMYLRQEGLLTVPGAVAFHIAERVTVEGNRFTHLGGKGLELSQSSSYNVVSGNVFTDSSDGGILLGVVPPDEDGRQRRQPDQRQLDPPRRRGTPRGLRHLGLSEPSTPPSRTTRSMTCRTPGSSPDRATTCAESCTATASSATASSGQTRCCSTAAASTYAASRARRTRMVSSSPAMWSPTATAAADEPGRRRAPSPAPGGPAAP